MIKRHY